MAVFFQVGLWIVFASFLYAPDGARAQVQRADVIKRGEYLFAIAGGCACHTVPERTPHAGGRAIEVPFGRIYSTNITTDQETGLGGWSDEDLHRSMVQGVRPNGENILPVMPYEAYSGMAEDDLRSLIAYLRTLKPVRHATPPMESWVPFFRPVFTPLWLKVFGRFSTPPARAPQTGVERGRYLVEHVSLCGDCHTPRNRIGVPDRSLYLAGNKQGPFGEEVPNITPHQETGIGKWSREEIAELVLTGAKPDGDNVQGLMAEVIEAGYKRMRREDALAIADYLKTAPAVQNKIN